MPHLETDITLPPEVEAGARAFDEGRSQPKDSTRVPDRDARLHTLSQLLCDKRKEAIDGRQNSGIEDEWLLCEEAYAGIDDANRHEFRHRRWEKSPAIEGPITPADQRLPQDLRSTVYPRLTSRYVNAGTAKLAEILLPTDDKAFSFTPTPVPELIEAKKNTEQVVLDGQPLERDARPEEVPGPPSGNGGPPVPPATAPPMAPGSPTAVPGTALPPGKPLTHKDLAEEKMHQAAEAAKQAEQRIYDQLVEAKYTREARKVIFDAARLGVGVLKGPVPKVVKRQAITPITDARGQRRGVKFELVEKVVPTVKRVNPWNVFPDPACGEDIHEGDYLFERDHLSPRRVAELKHERHYLPEALDQVLKEGPGKMYLDDRPKTADEQRRQFEVWYFYGWIDREDFAALNPDHAGEATGDTVAVIATLINDTVVRGVLHPLESGKIPYHAMPWEFRDGHWAGVGIAEQVRVPDRILKSATRALLDNAGTSAGSQIVMDRQGITPADDTWRITRDKLWYKNPDSTTEDVRKAFWVFELPNRTQQLMTIVEYAFRLAEESSNIPLITQGMSGATSPETLGATQLQNNNASQLLRNIGYTYDDYITEPLIDQMYEWHLLDEEVPPQEKGDWQIHAHGSSALVERAIQDQALVEMGELVRNASQAFDVNPRKWFAQMMKSKRLDPREFQYTEEEKAQQAQQQQPPPQVLVAQIRAEIEKYKAELDAKSEEADRQLERELSQLDMGEGAAPAGVSDAEMQLRLAEIQAKKELALIEYSNKRGITLEQSKTKLAETAMRLRTQKEIAAMTAQAKQVARDEVEPAGRAPAGQAFQR